MVPTFCYGYLSSIRFNSCFFYSRTNHCSLLTLCLGSGLDKDVFFIIGLKKCRMERETADPAQWRSEQEDAL